MAPKSIQFLLLSDIHFGESCSPDFSPKDHPPKHHVSGTVPMKRGLLERLKDRQFDALLVSGDLTGRASPTEFVECKATIDEIARALNIPSKNIFAAFGNHDVNWLISRLAEEPKESADPRYPEVAALIGPHFVRFSECSESGPVPGSGVFHRDDFVLFVANSGFCSSHDQKYSHGQVGKAQLDWLKTAIERAKDRSKWRVLLIHHHPFKYSYPTLVEDISCLEEGSELVDILGQSGFDLVCHGHRHHPKLFTEMRNGWASPVTFLCAGSLGANATELSNGEIPNLFHVVSLDSRDGNQAAQGNVETFRYFSPKGWVPVDNSALVPLDPLHRFGSVASDTQRTDDLKQVIAKIVASDHGEIVDMPLLGELPYSLQCLPTEELNNLLQKQANATSSHRALGQYPETVILQRVKK